MISEEIQSRVLLTLTVRPKLQTVEAWAGGYAARFSISNV